MIIDLLTAGIIVANSDRIEKISDKAYLLKDEAIIYQVEKREKPWDYMGTMKVYVVGLSGTATTVSSTSSTPCISVPLFGSFS